MDFKFASAQSLNWVTAVKAEWLFAFEIRCERRSFMDHVRCGMEFLMSQPRGSEKTGMMNKQDVALVFEDAGENTFHFMRES